MGDQCDQVLAFCRDHLFLRQCFSLLYTSSAVRSSCFVVDCGESRFVKLSNFNSITVCVIHLNEPNHNTLFSKLSLLKKGNGIAQTANSKFYNCFY